MCLDEPLQDIFGGGPVAGRGFGGGGEAEALKEDAAKLLRGVDVEGLAGKLVNARDKSGGLFTKLDAVARKSVGVDADAGVLHVGEDAHERVFGLGVGAPGAAFAHDGLERAVEAERHVGILGGVFGDLRDVDLVHRELPLALRADERLNGDRVVVQELARERVHAVALRGVDDVVREHGVGKRRRGLDAKRAQDVKVELHVVPALCLRGVGEDRGERGAEGGQAERSSAIGTRGCGRRRGRGAEEIELLRGGRRGGRRSRLGGEKGEEIVGCSRNDR